MTDIVLNARIHRALTILTELFQQDGHTVVERDGKVFARISTDDDFSAVAEVDLSAIARELGGRMG